MDIDYEDNIEIISETTNNLEQVVSTIFFVWNKMGGKTSNQDTIR